MANYTVSSTDDGGAGTLRNALAQASDGDTIGFADSLSGQTIRVTSPLNVTRGVTIDGGGDTTISGNQAGGASSNTGIFTVDAAGHSPVTISNLSINDGSSKGAKGAAGTAGTAGVNGGAGGNGFSGGNAAGGVYIKSGSVNLVNDTFANDRANGGIGGQGGKGAAGAPNGNKGAGGNAAGAVYVEPGATVTASRLTFTGNSANVGLGSPNGTAYLNSNSSIVVNGTGAAANPTPPANNAPCYCTGTRILTDRGVVAVEALAIGDVIVTASGQSRPIRWIGSRSYSGLSAPQHDCPVRIRAGAFAEGVPARDLLVSPDHALMVDGLFVAAGHLVNGTSIIRGEAVADLTYWHVELDSHDLLLAENTPAESFLAAPGVRAGFDGVQTLDADKASVPYAPRTELGPDLVALRGRLALRAISSGESTDLGPVRAWLDRCVVGADGLLHVGGWAWDPAQPDAPVCLDVMVDGALVAFTVASEYRADLAAAGVGDGRVGFDLGLDVRLAQGISHVVEVRRSADGALVCAKRIDAAGDWTALLAA